MTSLIPLPPKTELDAQRQALLDYYFDDPIALCRDIFPHWFTKPMPWVHRGLLAILLRRADFLLKFGEEQWSEAHGRWTKKDLSKIVRHFTYLSDPTDPASERKPIFRVRYGGNQMRTPIAIDMAIGQFANFILPREAAKTTVTNVGLLILILYQLIRYFVYISNTQTHANDQLATVKRELETNDRIHSLWGNIVPDRAASQTWAANEIETTTGVLGASKGRGTQIRGMNRFSVRPDFIIMDDIEDEESVATEEQLAKTQKWYMKAVEPALSKVKGSGRIFNLATIQATNDITMAHARDKRYTTVRFGAIDPDGDMLWSSYMTKAKLEALRLAYAARGQLFEFGLEYLSEINAEDQAKFKAKNLQRYKLLTPEEFIRDFPVRALAMDPAISKSVKACPCAFAVLGMNERGGFHVAAYRQKIGMSPREQIDLYFELSKTWGCTKHSIEAVAYQAALIHIVREEMFRKKHYFEIDEWLPGTDKRKFQRIEGMLQPRIASQNMMFNERWPELEAQFLQWPHGGMDGPDVIAMAVSMCDPFAGFGAPEEFDDEGKPIGPAILRDETMEPLDFDYRDLGVP